MTDEALKGRNLPREWLLCRPFRASHFVLNSFPGRCPGLSYYTPSGLKPPEADPLARPKSYIISFNKPPVGTSPEANGVT